MRRLDMARIVIGILVMLLVGPLFGMYGLFGALPILVMFGIVAVALFGRTSTPDDDVTRLGL